MSENTGTISRRAAIGGLAAGLAGAPAIAQAKPRALALVGDRYHNPDYIRVSLDKVFGELGIAIDYTMDYGALSASLLKPYQLFLVLRDGMIWPGGYLGPDAYFDYEANLENADDFPAPKPVTWMTESQGQAIKDFVNAGGGFYPLHNTSNVSVYNQDFRDVMGGAYLGHPPLRPFQVRPTANAHPITAGMKPFIDAAKAASVVVTVDGCETGCAQKTIQNIGIEPQAFFLTKMGLEKGKTTPSPELTAKLCQEIASRF